MRNEQAGLSTLPRRRRDSAFKGLVRPVLVSAAFFMVVTGIVLPAGDDRRRQHPVFPREASESLIVKDGKVVGSRQIGQYFTRPEYFHGRPSATSGTDPNDPSKTVDQPYNAALSGAQQPGCHQQEVARARSTSEPKPTGKRTVSPLMRQCQWMP